MMEIEKLFRIFREFLRNYEEIGLLEEVDFRPLWPQNILRGKIRPPI